MHGIPRGWGGTRRGFCITDQYAPYCSELRYAVSIDYIELADYWWMQQDPSRLDTWRGRFRQGKACKDVIHDSSGMTRPAR